MTSGGWQGSAVDGGWGGLGEGRQDLYACRVLDLGSTPSATVSNLLGCLSKDGANNEQDRTKDLELNYDPARRESLSMIVCTAHSRSSQNPQNFVGINKVGGVF